MKPSVSNSRIVLALAAALVACLAVPRANADEWNKRTILTVNQPVQVRDTLLEPGSYVLQLMNSSSDRHIVQIFNHDQSHIINTILAIPKERMEATGDSQFVFWETPPGTAKALRAWFYPGDLIGQEFPYPKHPKMLAMASESTSAVNTVSESTSTSTAVEPPPPVATPTPVPVPEPTPVTEEPQPVTDQTPPPAQTPPVTDQTPPNGTADRSAPAELPKTGSPYPLWGVSGAALLTLAGLLRLKRAGSR